jgi:hypothetical protein
VTIGFIAVMFVLPVAIVAAAIVLGRLAGSWKN